MWHLANHGNFHHTPSVRTHCLGAAVRGLAFQALNAPRLAEHTFPVQIDALDLYHAPRISWAHEDRFYVEADVDGQVKATAVVNKHELPWKDTLKFDIRESSIITLRVFAERMLHEDTHIGSVQEKISAFLGPSDKANIIHDLVPPHSDDHHYDSATKTKISFSIKRIPEGLEHHANIERVESIHRSNSQPSPEDVQQTPTNQSHVRDVGLSVKDQRTPATEPHMEDLNKSTVKWDKPKQCTDAGSTDTSQLQLSRGLSGEDVCPPSANQSKLPAERQVKEDHQSSQGQSQRAAPTTQSTKDVGPSSSEQVQPKLWERDLANPTLSAIIALFPNDSQIQQFLNNANAFSPLLDKIDLFLVATESFGDIHPYVKMAAIILTGVVKVFTAQMYFASTVKNLVDAMVDAHTFLSEADPLNRIESHREIIKALSAQTVECSYFIKDITKNGGFARVMNQFMVMNVERKSRDYIQKFQDLRASLRELATITTATTVLRLYDDVQGISRDVSLDAMHYAEDVHYSNVERCNTLEADQLQLVDEITGWINSDTTERIYYLCGPARWGKTSVARTVAHLFDGLQRLASSYFVREPIHPTSHHNHPRFPTSVLRTISRDIADHHPHFKRTLGEKVRKRAIRVTNNICTQFEELILHPAQTISEAGPVVVVIDDLDNCGDRGSRKDLLNVLANRAAELPPNFRVLITSRPEADIVAAFQDKAHILVKTVEDATLPDNDSGVSFSPIETPAGPFVSCPRDAALELPHSSDEEEELTEDQEVYGHLHDEQMDQRLDDVLLIPLALDDTSTPRTLPNEDSYKRRLEMDMADDLHPSTLRRARTVHPYNIRRARKPFATTGFVHKDDVFADIGRHAEAGSRSDQVLVSHPPRPRGRSESPHRTHPGHPFGGTRNLRSYNPRPAHYSQVIVSEGAFYAQPL